MIELDLFKLHSKEDRPLGWIWIEFNPNLVKEEYLKLLEKRTQKEILIKINKNLNAGTSTIEKHLIKLKKSTGELWLPLPIVIELVNLFKNKNIKNKVTKNISFLTCKTSHQDKIKAVIYINQTLAKIVGAHIADGYLKRENGTYRIKVCDGKKEIIEVFSTWIKETFELDSIIRFSKKDNTWICWFNNKIIGRYLEKLFEIPPGKKSYIVKEPNLIKKSSFAIRKSFTLGIFTFDGGVKTTGMVSISSKSRDLIDDLYNILILDGIPVKKSYNKKKKFWLLESISGRNKQYLKKWEDYFERGASKFKKLNFFINPKPIQINELNELSPKSSKGKISLIDVYNSMCKNNSNYKKVINEISKEKKVSKTTLYKYLYILKKSCATKCQ